MNQKKSEIDNRLNYSIIIITLCLIILFGLVSWLAEEGIWNIFEIPAKYQSCETTEDNFVNYEISDRAEIYSVSGGEEDLFKEVIFDPHILTPPTEEQFIVVTLKQPDKIESFTIVLEDEKGIYTKDFYRFLELDGMASYIIKWTPEEIIASKYYSVIFEYKTIEGETNFMKLFWHSKFD